MNPRTKTLPSLLTNSGKLMFPIGNKRKAVSNTCEWSRMSADTKTLNFRTKNRTLKRRRVVREYRTRLIRVSAAAG